MTLLSRKLVKSSIVKFDRFRSYELLILILLMSCTPQFVYMSFYTTSTAVGLLVASVLSIFWIGIIRKEFKARVRPTTLILFLLFSIYFSVSSFHSLLTYGSMKPLYSLSLIIVGFSAYFISKLFIKASFASLQFALRWSTYLLLAIGYIKLAWVPHIFRYKDAIKSVFPFSEESHYALALGPILAAYIINASVKESVFVVSLALVLSLSYPSLLLLVFVMFAVLVLMLRLKVTAWHIIGFFCAVLSALLVRDRVITNPYFEDRLSVSSTENLTALVYTQGWELISENIGIDRILGVGFQMLGKETTIFTDSSDVIESITGHSSNIQDGGFLAAKIITEFGFLGLGLIIAYVFLSFRCLLIVFSASSRGECQYNFETKKLICVCVWILSFSIEIFLRGYGYFSPGLLLFLVCLISLKDIERAARYN